MLYYLQGIIVVILEVVFYKIYMETFSDYKRTKRYLNHMMIVVLVVSLYLEVNIFTSSILIKELVCFATMVLVSYIWFDSKMLRIGIQTLIYMGILLVTDYLTLVFYTIIFSDDILESILGQSLIIAVDKIVLFLLIILIHNNLDKNKIAVLIDSEWIKFLYFPLFSICIIIASITNVGSITDSRNEQLFWVIAFGLVGMNVLVFALLNSVIEREAKLRENKVAEIKATQQLLLYRSISENYSKESEKLHEYKNQIECLHGLSKAGNYRELESYLTQIAGELFNELDSINTNHSVVNAVLNSKYQEAVKRGITVVFKINDLSGLWLEEKDVVTIIANLIDNAIEALEKCDKKKIMKIKAVIEDSQFIFSVSNTYAGELQYQNGHLVTTKIKDRKNHGIGLRNVIKAVEKYNGFYAINPKGKEFLFSAIINEK